MTALIVVLAITAFVLAVLGKTVRIVPQGNAVIVERLGRYQRTLEPGLALVVPFVDKLGAPVTTRATFVIEAGQPGAKRA